MNVRTSLFRARPLVAAAFLAAASAAHAAGGGGGPTLSVALDPVQPRYFAGQRVSCVISLDLGGAELHGGGDLSLSGFPENGPAVDFGRFRPLSAGPGGELRWAAPLALLAPTNLALRPRISGAMRRETSRQGSFFRTYSVGEFDASAEPLEVAVSAVPSDGRPADFCGAVGPLHAEISLSPLDCSPGDLLTLRWSLTGPGAELASVPAWSPGPGFKAYPPRVDEREEGRISVSQIVVPLAMESAGAAPFSLSWFDPASGWKRRDSGPFRLSLRERDETPPPPETPPGAEDGGTPAPDAGTGGTGESAAVSGRETARSAEARFAPGPRAAVLFEIPAGTPVETVETHGGWSRVAVPGGAAGWVRTDVLK